MLFRYILLMLTDLLILYSWFTAAKVYCGTLGEELCKSPWWWGTEFLWIQVWWALSRFSWYRILPNLVEVEGHFCGVCWLVCLFFCPDEVFFHLYYADLRSFKTCRRICWNLNWFKSFIWGSVRHQVTDQTVSLFFPLQRAEYRCWGEGWILLNSWVQTVVILFGHEKKRASEAFQYTPVKQFAWNVPNAKM